MYKGLLNRETTVATRPFIVQLDSVPKYEFDTLEEAQDFLRMQQALGLCRECDIRQLSDGEWVPVPGSLD